MFFFFFVKKEKQRKRREKKETWLTWTISSKASGKARWGLKKPTWRKKIVNFWFSKFSKNHFGSCSPETSFFFLSFSFWGRFQMKIPFPFSFFGFLHIVKKFQKFGCLSFGVLVGLCSFVLFVILNLRANTSHHFAKFIQKSLTLK